mmetsp:Transcript_92400/g.298643  ORF Transcript_92400/g.298643 Transcript_92400/m.298643 type:complete len:86 (-) Transcript_92400:115-372(-)
MLAAVPNLTRDSTSVVRWLLTAVASGHWLVAPAELWDLIATMGRVLACTSSCVQFISWTNLEDLSPIFLRHGSSLVNSTARSRRP